MNTKQLALTIKRISILGVIIMLFSLLAGCSEYDFSGITYFSYGYTPGYGPANFDTCYKLELNNGVYTATIKQSEIAPEDADEFVVDEAFVEKLTKLLADNNVQKWNGFNKSDSRVCDGSSFTLKIKIQNEDAVEAHGYMKWPKNYHEVKKEIEAMFMELYTTTD
ncbi:MAG: hypothetical protein UD936_09610 [Acutalibacteraceae bacterium]|nr:hypothetical protein [Acutalibacteraceae bacterium]